jgi:hypothetical protein
MKSKTPISDANRQMFGKSDGIVDVSVCKKLERENAELKRVISVLVEWNNGVSMDRAKIMKAFSRAEALVAKGGK